MASSRWANGHLLVRWMVLVGLALIALANVSVVQSSPVKRILHDTNAMIEARYGMSVDLSECLAQGKVDFVDAKRNDSHVYFEASQGDNVRFHWHPLAIAFPRDKQQVSSVVLCAKQNGNVQTVARSGGHSFSGFSSGGQDRALIVDFRNMDAIVPDRAHALAHVQPGARLGDVAKALWADGERAMPHGTCPTVGVGGHTLCGGIGPMSRHWGMATDNLVEAEVVLSDGSIVLASQHQHPELWWALRGAGSYFGLVTKFTFSTYSISHPVVNIEYKWGTALKDKQDPVKLMQAVQAFGLHPDLPSEVGFHMMITPGKMSSAVLEIALRGLYMGDRASYEQAVQSKLRAELTRFGVPLADEVHEDEVSYIKFLEAWDDFGKEGDKLNTQLERKVHNNFITRTSLAVGPKTFSDQGFAKIFDLLWQRLWDEKNGVLPQHTISDVAAGEQTFWQFTQFFEFYGGAKNRMRDSELVQSSAMAHRDSTWLMQSSVGSSAFLPLRHEAHDFLQSLDSTIQTAMKDDQVERMGYSCYLDSTEDDWAHLYYGKSLPRMIDLKKKLDGNNLFRSPQSIIDTPAAPSAAGKTHAAQEPWLLSPHPLP